jgi:hypothetical protein
VALAVGVLVGGARLHLAPLAVQDVLARGDQVAGVRDARLVDDVLGDVRR